MRTLFYAAAVCIAIAGILHLTALAIDPHHSETPSITTFFILAGIAQIFWVLPTAKHWGKPWYYAGIAGNAALIVLWVLTRMPNPITGEAEPINAIGLAVEVLQGTYIGLMAIIIVRQKQMMKIHRKRAEAA